jgi:hypothetical protein
MQTAGQISALVKLTGMKVKQQVTHNPARQPYQKANTQSGREKNQANGQDTQARIKGSKTLKQDEHKQWVICC